MKATGMFEKMEIRGCVTPTVLEFIKIFVIFVSHAINKSHLFEGPSLPFHFELASTTFYHCLVRQRNKCLDSINSEVYPLVCYP
jgi:hypothetical protein